MPGTCIFFNDRMADMPGSAEIFEDRYRRGQNANWARFMVFEKLGRAKVPPSLFPNESEKARKILAGG